MNISANKYSIRIITQAAGLHALALQAVDAVDDALAILPYSASCLLIIWIDSLSAPLSS